LDDEREADTGAEFRGLGKDLDCCLAKRYDEGEDYGKQSAVFKVRGMKIM